MFLSIVIPTYNCGKTINRCLTSIIEQPVSDYEIIIVDDCSTDDTVLKCSIFCNSHKNIRLIQSKTKLGPMNGRITGVKESTGKYIIFIDGDDTLKENSLSLLYTLVQNNPLIDCFIYKAEYISTSGVVSLHHPELNKTNEIIKSKEEILRRCFIDNIYFYMWDKCFRTSIAKKIKIEDRFIKYKYCEDFLMSYIYISNCDAVFLSNSVIYQYRQNSLSLTNNLRIEDYDTQWEIYTFIFNQIKHEIYDFPKKRCNFLYNFNNVLFNHILLVVLNISRKINSLRAMRNSEIVRTSLRRINGFRLQKIVLTLLKMRLYLFVIIIIKSYDLFFPSNLSKYKVNQQNHLLK